MEKGTYITHSTLYVSLRCVWCDERCVFVCLLHSHTQVGSGIAILGTYLYTLASDKFAAEQKAKKAKS